MPRNRNLELSARNIKGLELIPGNEVASLSFAEIRSRDFFSSRDPRNCSLPCRILLPQESSASMRRKKEGRREKGRRASPRKRVRHEKAAEVA